jgi:hypothetical protein
MKKTPKNGNQALTNVPFSKEISPTQKLKKQLLLCREPGGAIGKGPVPSVGRRHRRVLCRQPAPAGSRQRPVNRVKPGSTPLPRAEEGALGASGICADDHTIQPSAKGYFRFF